MSTVAILSHSMRQCIHHKLYINATPLKIHFNCKSVWLYLASPPIPPPPSSPPSLFPFFALSIFVFVYLFCPSHQRDQVYKVPVFTGCQGRVFSCADLTYSCLFHCRRCAGMTYSTVGRGNSLEEHRPQEC